MGTMLFGRYSKFYLNLLKSDVIKESILLQYSLSRKHLIKVTLELSLLSTTRKLLLLLEQHLQSLDQQLVL